jgi:hypothetical protein
MPYLTLTERNELTGREDIHREPVDNFEQATSRLVHDLTNTASEEFTYETLEQWFESHGKAVVHNGRDEWFEAVFSG